MRIKKYKSINYFLIVLGCFSLALVLVGEWKTATALWIMTACLLPSLWMAMGTSYVIIKFYCATVLVTQMISLSSFYLNPYKYTQSPLYYSRPFEFGALDTFRTYIILGLFLFLLVFLVKLIERKFDSSVKQKALYNAFLDFDRRRGYLSILKPNYSFYSTIIILTLIAISLPIKLWMFNIGVGIVGVHPPKLPFRLSGILFYLSNYLIPIAIGYFYIKTKRNSFPIALIISVYALIIGVLSASKAVVLLPITPIIAFALLDRRWLIFSFAFIIAALGVLMIASTRSIVYVDAGMSAFTDLGGFGTLSRSFFELSWSSNMLLVIVDLANRFAGFQDMFLSSQFNADAIGGEWNIFLNLITFGQYVTIEHNAIHQEYLGYSIPYGYYGVAATFNAWMMMAVNKNILMMLPFAIYAAFILAILEKFIKRLLRKYSSTPAVELSSLSFAAIIFFTNPASIILLTLITLIFVFYLFPRIVLQRR